MPDRNPSTFGRKTVLGGAVAVAIALVAAAIWRFAPEAPAPAPSPPPAATPAPAPPRAAPASPQPISRAELLSAAATAAATYAAGAAPPPELAVLAGQRFRLRIPFGCSGASGPAPGRAAWWSYEPDKRTLKLSVRPQSLMESTLVRDLGGAERFDAVEAYWIPMPWLASEDCPATPVAAAPEGETDAAPPAPVPSLETVGLAVFFDKGATRVGRRAERPYEITRKVAEAAPEPGAAGFRLRLEGRLTGYGDGTAVRCQSASPYQRPVCLFAVQIDKAAIEDPASGETLGEWTG